MGHDGDLQRHRWQSVRAFRPLNGSQELAQIFSEGNGVLLKSVSFRRKLFELGIGNRGGPGFGVFERVYWITSISQDQEGRRDALQLDTRAVRHRAWDCLIGGDDGF